MVTHSASQPIYLDSNIFLDFWLDRSENGIPVGDFAHQLLRSAILCRYTIVISESTIFELNRNYPGGNIEKKFDDLKKLNKIKIERVTEKHLLDAKKLAYRMKVPVHDAVHALICKEQKAVMVTRDAHFFEKLSDIVLRVARAEEMLLL